jgi:hypothetical protein
VSCARSARILSFGVVWRSGGLEVCALCFAEHLAWKAGPGKGGWAPQGFIVLAAALKKACLPLPLRLRMRLTDGTGLLTTDY